MLSALIFAAALQTPPTIDDYKFLAGIWRAEAGGSNLEMNWSEPSGGTMLGVGKEFTLAETKSLEFLAIQPRENTFILWLQTTLPSRGEPRIVQFRLVKVDPEKKTVTFENPHNQFPTKVTYERGSETALKATLEGMRDGKTVKVERVYKKG